MDGPEYTWCLLYRENQETDECRGANGRKLRSDCPECPNWQRWKNRQEKVKERKTEHGNDGDKSKDDH